MREATRTLLFCPWSWSQEAGDGRGKQTRARLISRKFSNFASRHRLRTDARDVCGLARNARAGSRTCVIRGFEDRRAAAGSGGSEGLARRVRGASAASGRRFQVYDEEYGPRLISTALTSVQAQRTGRSRRVKHATWMRTASPRTGSAEISNLLKRTYTLERHGFAVNRITDFCVAALARVTPAM